MNLQVKTYIGPWQFTEILHIHRRKMDGLESLGLVCLKLTYLPFHCVDIKCWQNALHANAPQLLAS